MTLETAKRLRLKLMKERVKQIAEMERGYADDSDCLFSGKFNLCEH